MAEMAHQAAHFHRKGESDTAWIEKARGHFLNIYSAEHPRVLSELWKLVPLYPADANPALVIRSAVPYLYPELARGLSAWARESLLTFNGEPAGWAMDTALETLRTWRMSCRRFVCVEWSHDMAMHNTYPAGSPEYFNVPGESESDALAEAISVQITIPPWNRPNGETEREFKVRFYAECDRAYEEHIRAAKGWWNRQTFERPPYIDGLAMWQAGTQLSAIRVRLASVGLNVGSPGDLSGISSGLDSAADFIEIDRRAG